MVGENEKCLKQKPLKTPMEEFKHLVRLDYDLLYDTINLDANDKILPFLLPQSNLGRAIEGHGGIFRGKKFPETTMGDILSALNIDPVTFRRKRQEMVDDFLECVDRLFEGKIEYLVNKVGKPIYGVKFLKDIKLNIKEKDTFKGGLIAARMDAIEWRIKTLEHYNRRTLNKTLLEIGGGKEFPVDIIKLKEKGLSLECLAKEPHSMEIIQNYKNNKIVTDRISPEVETAYIRYEKGLGVCDDAALIRIGKKHGESGMLLGFCLDATDTYGKFIEDVITGGVDDMIGDHIAQRWKEKYNEDLVKPEEIYDVIYFAAKNNSPKIDMSSSHRRFIQYEEGAYNSTFINHVRFLNGEEIEPFKIGFKKMKSNKFYKKIKKRLEAMDKK